MAALPDEIVASLSGIDQLNAMIGGRAPGPTMARTMGFTLARVADGEAVFVGEPTEAHLNPMGTVHGGWAATILDSALGCAVHTTLGPGERYTTLELKVNLTRALMPGTGPVTCTGRILTRGRRVATSDAQLVDGAGRVLAHGTTTCLIMPAEG